MNNWTLLSNHGHVLVCLARDPKSRLRDVAADVGITERAVQKIVRDLQENGMVSVTKNGRRNRYHIHHEQTLRHDLESHCTLGEFAKFVKISGPGNGLSAKAVPTKAGPVSIEPVKSGPDRPEIPEHASIPPVPVKPEAFTREPAKSETENSIERQQGSLF